MAIIIANAVATGTNDDGTAFSYSWMTGQPYLNATRTRDAQVAAGIANAATLANYMTELNVAQQDVEKGVNPVAPVKPNMQIVHDQWNKDGTPQVTYGPFVPPLPDLVPATVAGPTMIDTIAAARASAPPDPAVVTMNGVQFLVEEFAALQAMVAKIAAAVKA